MQISSFKRFRCSNNVYKISKSYFEWILHYKLSKQCVSARFLMLSMYTNKFNDDIVDQSRLFILKVWHFTKGYWMSGVAAEQINSLELTRAQSILTNLSSCGDLMPNWQLCFLFHFNTSKNSRYLNFVRMFRNVDISELSVLFKINVCLKLTPVHYL